MRAPLKEELAKMAFALPVMPLLTEHLKARGFVSTHPIGWHCHLTEITAAAAEALLDAGATLLMSECNPETTSKDAVEYMRKKGAQIFLGEGSCAKVLEGRPKVISDTGLVLTRQYESTRGNDNFVYAGSEITTSGITALREMESLSLPVVDINSGQLKTWIENYHGVADGVMDLLAQVTGRVWTGHHVAVVGYGVVGNGVATYLKRSGAAVTVVDANPVRRLIAHYDGFATATLQDALTRSSLVVTATGAERLITTEHWQLARDEALFVNVGHWASELDITALQALSESSQQYAAFLKEYTLKFGKRIYVIAEGGPANVVTLSGSQEPTLIHLTTEILCMNYLLESHARGIALKPGAQALPAELERTAAELALQALNLSN